MPTLDIRLLGQFQVTYDDQRVETLGSARLQSLLAYLVLHRGTPLSRQQLAFLFWPDSTDAQARTNLRKALHDLRRALPDADTFVQADGQTIAWVGDASCTLDVAAFEAALDEAERDEGPGETAQALARAGDLYTGDLLPSCYDDWILPERQELRARYISGLEHLAELLEQIGDRAAAIEQTQRLLRDEPMHEPAHRRLMRLLAVSGQRSAALVQYETCVRVLEEELGVEPGDETQQLYQRIRNREDLSDLSLTGLQVHSSHNLPGPLTPFIGREELLSEVVDRLGDADCRVLTLLGPGGIGKTRLALQAAKEQLNRGEERILWVSLAQASTMEGLVSAVAGAAGFSTYRASDPWQRLLDDLREERMLLVLDNLEHLLDVDHAAGRSATDLITDILRAAPGVRILATSRVRANVRSECLLPVSGMSYPLSASRTEDARDGTGPYTEQAGSAPGSAAGYDAVRLFLATARRVRPGFEPTDAELADVVHICRLVEGMPLAILLAAAWMEMLSPAEIMAELTQGYDLLQADLRDLPERHRSIEAVFDASWRMLDRVERETLASLSVFRGGFTWEAAQEVVNPNLRTLFSLVHKSFLHRDSAGRYEVHELLRQYGERKLVEQPEERDRIADLHCAYYARLVDRRGMRGGPLVEIDNLRAGWRWAVSRARYTEIVRYGDSFMLYLYQGRYPEAVTSLEWAVDLLRPSAVVGDTRGAGIALGIVLIALGRIGQLRDPGVQVQRREQLTMEGVSLLRRLGARRELASVADVVAWTCLPREAVAIEVAQDSLAFYREGGDLAGAAEMLGVLGELAIRRGAYDEGERLSREARALGQTIDGQPGVGYAILNLAKIAYFRGEYERAVHGYQDLLARVSRDAPNAFVAEVRSHLGDAALAMGDYQLAREQHGRSEALWREMALPWAETASGQYHGLAYSLLRLCDIALALGEPERAQERYEEALEIARDRPQDSLNLDVVVTQAALLTHDGALERAVALAALVLHHPSSGPEVRARALKLIEQAKAALPPDVFARTVDRGRRQDLESTMTDLFRQLGG